MEDQSLYEKLDEFNKFLDSRKELAEKDFESSTNSSERMVFAFVQTEILLIRAMFSKIYYRGL